MKAFIRRMFQKFGYDIRRVPGAPQKVWIDVGSHLGQGTLDAALRDSELLIFAFEPNWSLARQTMGKATNFVVLPMAISDKNGLGHFFVRTDNASVGSSLLPINEASVSRHWSDVQVAFSEPIQVPTIRLDTFMEVAGISVIDYLKIDAQGAEFTVLRSAGKRLQDIRKVTTEIFLTPELPYQGAVSRAEFVAFMTEQGFRQIAEEIEPRGRHGDFTFTR
jgi:FkbM family methyltransferase